MIYKQPSIVGQQIYNLGRKFSYKINKYSRLWPIPLQSIAVNNYLYQYARPTSRPICQICQPLVILNERSLFRRLNKKNICIESKGLKNKNFDNVEDQDNKLSKLFTPIEYEKSEFEESLGKDIVGPLVQKNVLQILQQFFLDKEVREFALEQGLDKYLFHETYVSFRRFCINTDNLPTDLHIVINDIVKGASHLHDLYPYFFKHAKDIFPHLNCMEDLYKVSDLTHPPNWYPDARAINRKIIFHAGPTNSGKTYHAMEQYLSANTGVYCGPLKLLAAEVFQKSNEKGTPCDLITGEERKYAVSEEFPANHTSCTIEMASTNTRYDVAILDEIQMMKDPTRGWAWTRAFFGICADEIHVCGEGAAIDLVKELALTNGEDVEVRRYKRLTKLHVDNTALVSFDLVQPGDCIVCFSKAHIHFVSQTIERLGHQVAVIYGALPPTVKLEQARKFNDPNHPCKILVATDAIGMGINLSIRRIVFYSLIKPTTNVKGEKEIETIGVSQALQIAGRAGRYGTCFDEGYVTTFKSSDLPVLTKILKTHPDPIEKAGLHPTSEQIELFAFHLPTYTLSNLIDIFIKLCTVESNLYYMCLLDDFKFLANMIQHVPLPLRARYILCCSPINKKMTFVCAIFLKISRKFSQNEPITMPWICQQVKWPFIAPRSIEEMVHLEEVSQVFDLYLWLGYRFPDMFPDNHLIQSLVSELDEIIGIGVSNITKLLKNSQQKDDNAEVNTKMSKSYLKLFKKTDGGTKLRDSVKTLRGFSTTESLTQRLLRQGIISPKMLDDMQKEWKNNLDNGNDGRFGKKKK